MARRRHTPWPAPLRPVRWADRWGPVSRAMVRVTGVTLTGPSTSGALESAAHSTGTSFEEVISVAALAELPEDAGLYLRLSVTDVERAGADGHGGTGIVDIIRPQVTHEPIRASHLLVSTPQTVDRVEASWSRRRWLAPVSEASGCSSARDRPRDSAEASVAHLADALRRKAGSVQQEAG